MLSSQILFVLTNIMGMMQQMSSLRAIGTYGSKYSLTLYYRMPNAKGGKGYKKGKHGGADEEKLFEWNPKNGEMLGRVVKSLGNRRFRVFCNDNKERIAKLPGSMRKSEWIEEGSLVLIGVRELSNATAKQGEDVADILTLAHTSLYGKLKKVSGVNPILFGQVEKEDPFELARKIKAQEAGEAIDDDDLFDRGDEEDEEDQEENLEGDDELTGEERQKKKQLKRQERDKLRDQKIADARKKKEQNDNSDVDVDAI
jgi:initiation factor 1A